MQKSMQSVSASEPALVFGATAATTAAPIPGQKVSNTSRLGGSTDESSGKQSNGNTTVKKQQTDKLHQVKWRTITAAIIVDLILVAALIYQLVSLNSSLTDFLHQKVSNTLKFYDFQYNERFDYAELGQYLYQNSTTVCDALLHGDPAAVAEIQRRLRYDQIWRSTEIMAIVDTTGRVVTSAGPDSAVGQHFDTNGLIELYMNHYATSGQSVRTSLMLDRATFQLFQSPVYDAVGDSRPDLTSWPMQRQTLARVVMSPVNCNPASASPSGFIIYADCITPRQYDFFGTLLFNTKSSIGAILARDMDTGLWQTAFSYNQAGAYGPPNKFPDAAVDIFPSSAYLNSVMDAGTDAIRTGTFTYAGVPYLYSITSAPRTKVGAVVDQRNDLNVGVVYFYAEPQIPISHAVHTAMSWQIPWIIILLLWSMISSRFVIKKWVAPMQQLIETVKRKKMKEFNDQLRVIKSNKAALWQLFAKMLITEAVIVGLIFANKTLLQDIAPDFTSAIVEGKVLSYVITSRSTNLLLFLAAWSSNPLLLSAAGNRTSAQDQVAHLLGQQRQILGVEGVFLISMNSDIIASSYAPGVGRSFPEAAVMDYLRSQQSASSQHPFSAHTAWTATAVNFTTDAVLKGPAGAPALVRLVVAPIRSVTLSNTTDDGIVLGDMIGAIVILRFINGADTIWIIDAFTDGFFGLYLWDRYHEAFCDMTSVFKTPQGLQWGYDITSGNSDLLQSGLISQYNHDHVLVAPNVRIGNQPYTASVTPYERSDEIVLTPTVTNAFVVRGLSQSSWNAVFTEQLALEIVNIILVLLIAVTKVVLAWLPLRRFLSSLEQAFTITSLSGDRAAKREQAATAMFEGTAEASSPHVSKRKSGSTLNQNSR